jgi:hypothetical protein
MYLAPIALSFLLLAFWTALGWALIAATEPNKNPLQSLFLAPIAGIAVTLLPTFWLSAAGLPVSSFARPLLFALCLTIVAGWIWRRPAWRRSELIFVVPAVAAVVIFAIPSIRFGFDWVANANDDWANYNLSAIRYLTDGYYQPPPVDAMAGGRDYPGFLWFLTVAGDARPGSDLLLALISAFIGRNPFFVFMPLVLALHGVFCMAAAALAMASFKRRDALFAALLLMSLAPLNLYAVYQQLIAQILGLAFMCGTACLVFAPLSELLSRGRIIIGAVFVAAYWLAYPETVPFFGVAFIIFHFLRLRDPNWGWLHAGKILAIPVIAGILLGPYAISFFFYLLWQIQGSGTQGLQYGVSIFPYFSVPSGIAVLFGLSRLGEFFKEPLLSISIAAAFSMAGAAAIGLTFDLVRKGAIGVYLISIVLAAMVLVKQHNNFGIFKLAMFAQTFIWFALLLSLMKIGRRSAFAIYAIILAAIVSSDVKTIMSARSDEIGSASALYGASKDRLLSKVFNERTADSCDANFFTPNPPLAKLFAASVGCARSFLARPYLLSQFQAVSVKTVVDNPAHNISGITEYTKTTASRLLPKLLTLNFPNAPAPLSTFKPAVEFSKKSDPWSLPSIYRGPNEPSAGELIYLNSSLGSYFYLPELSQISLFENESDTFFAGSQFAAAGRYLLFRINSPAARYRLVLDLTTSILADGKSQLPPARVIGESAASIGLVGNGAARVLSPTFKPLVVDGVSYVLLDLGTDPKNIQTPRTGLMALYGNDVDIDYRRIVAFLRRVRLKSEDASLADTAPSKVQSFPADLSNHNLEFSGFYEDGWVGDRGFLKLHSDAAGSAVIRGTFPAGIGIDSVELSMTVGDGEPVRRTLAPGPFVISAPAPKGSSRIAFEFSKIGKLPGADGRPAVALISSVAIENADTDLSIATPKSIANAVKDSSGLYWDSWASPYGSLTVEAKKDSILTLTGVIYGIEGQQIIIGSDASTIIQRDLPDGAFTIEVPIKAGRSAVSFAFSKTMIQEGRKVSALIQSATIDSPSSVLGRLRWW